MQRVAPPPCLPLWANPSQADPLSPILRVVGSDSAYFLCIHVYAIACLGRWPCSIWSLRPRAIRSSNTPTAGGKPGAHTRTRCQQKPWQQPHSTHISPEPSSLSPPCPPRQHMEACLPSGQPPRRTRPRTPPHHGTHQPRLHPLHRTNIHIRLQYTPKTQPPPTPGRRPPCLHGTAARPAKAAA
jgi:hypothetical protein